MNYRVKEKISMADLAFRVQAVIKTEVDVTEAQLSRNGIDVVHGVARFVDPTRSASRARRTDTTLEADRIIIAVGTKPADSPKVPINGRTIVNSDQISTCPSCRARSSSSAAASSASNTPACSPCSACASR
jgi:NAD(P) transhydrogenase